MRFSLVGSFSRFAVASNWVLLLCAFTTKIIKKKNKKQKKAREFKKTFTGT
jgi:hypothetical protein